MIDTPTLTGVYTVAPPPANISDANPRDPERAVEAWIWIEQELANSGMKSKWNKI